MRYGFIIPRGTAHEILTMAQEAEARFEEMGDEIPESARGKRVGVETYEVVWEGSP